MSTNPERPTCLVLIRHGETVGNQQGLWAGWSDTPLSEQGWDQIRRTAERLQGNEMAASALYSSPIGRAWETALAIGRAIQLSPIPSQVLKEMHFGDLELVNGDRFEQDYPQVYARWRFRTDESFGWPGGETRRQFRSRVVDTMAGLSDAHRGQTVLVVTHSGVIRMALAHFVPDRFGTWWDVKPGNCSLTQLMLDGSGQAQVPVYNDVAHLAE